MRQLNETHKEFAALERRSSFGKVSTKTSTTERGETVNTASSTEAYVLLMHLVDLHFNHGLQEIVHEAFFFSICCPLLLEFILARCM